MTSVLTKIKACRHPKDDKFLELAVDGHADVIITGDKDLLALHPFEGIDILRPLDYLDRLGAEMKAINVQDICALLSVYDMPEAVRFYTELLGFEVVSRAPTYEVIEGVEHFHWCILKNGDSQLMLNTEYDTGERPPQRPTFTEQRFGVWLYFGCQDVDGAYEQLRAAGITCDAPKTVKYGGKHRFRAISFRVPDGHGITLQWPLEQ